MGKSFELSMTLDYVSDWTFVDAMREFFQNILDEEIQNPLNKWFFKYYPEESTIRMGNKYGILKPNSLLLGSTSKKDDDNTLGEHGEGYKVATIVLLRTGHFLNIYNSQRNEIWKASIVRSEKYEEDIVKFDVSEGKYLFDEDSLVFEIIGVTEEEFLAIRESNLWLHESGLEFHKNNDGSVLLDEDQQGRIYVNGLFVKHVDYLTYGYNFRPGLVKLDRDRHTLDTWDLEWTISSLVSKFPPLIINQLKHAPECKRLSTYLESFSQDVSKVYDDSFDKFKETYGDKAVPVLTDRDFNMYAQQGYTCVKLSSNEYSLVTRSSKYKKVELDVKKSMKDLVNDLDVLYNKVCILLSDNLKAEMLGILEDMKGLVNEDE